jgi:hypothetical protein
MDRAIDYCLLGGGYNIDWCGCLTGIPFEDMQDLVKNGGDFDVEDIVESYEI